MVDPSSSFDDRRGPTSFTLPAGRPNAISMVVCIFGMLASDLAARTRLLAAAGFDFWVALRGFDFMEFLVWGLEWENLP